MCVCVCIIISLNGKISEKFNKVGLFSIDVEQRKQLTALVSVFRHDCIGSSGRGLCRPPEGVSRTDFGSGVQDPLSSSHGHWLNGVPHSCEKLSFFCWLAVDGSPSQF